MKKYKIVLLSKTNKIHTIELINTKEKASNFGNPDSERKLCSTSIYGLKK